MLKAMRERLHSKRAIWAAETENRIEEYREQQRTESLEKMKKEVEIHHLLHEEIDKYLNTIHPSFLLNSDVAKALHQRLLARSQGRPVITWSLTSEMRLALDFYQSDLSVFIRLLERKGFKIKGNENRIFIAFLNKLSENNYKKYIERYGDFANDIETLEASLLKYLEVVGDHNQLDSGRMDFLNKYLINKGLLPPEYTSKKLKKQIKMIGKIHREDYKISRLEKRMESIG